MQTAAPLELKPLLAVRDTVGHRSAWRQVEAGSGPDWPAFERGSRPAAQR